MHLIRNASLSCGGSGVIHLTRPVDQCFTMTLLSEGFRSGYYTRCGTFSWDGWNADEQ